MKKGHIFVIRPKEDCGVGRIEKNKDKLRALYQMGYDDAKAELRRLGEM